MPRTEVLTTLRIRLLDGHVRIAEPNNDNLASRILDVDSTLLPLTRRVERIVQRHLLALVGITFLEREVFIVQDFAARRCRESLRLQPLKSLRLFREEQNSTLPLKNDRLAS